MIRFLFSAIGIVFIVSFFFTDPDAKTEDGFSLAYFFLLMGIWFVGLPWFIRAIAGYRRKKRQERKSYFVSQGIEATATIESAEATGVLINHFPQYLFYLRLTTRDGRELERTEKKVIDFMDMGRLQPGALIPAYIDPDNDAKFFVCWDQANYPARA